MNIWRYTVPAGTTLIAGFPSSDRDRGTGGGTGDRETGGGTGDREFASRTWARETVSSMAIRHIGKIQDHEQGHRAFARTEG
jgi:hypothetical protein